MSDRLRFCVEMNRILEISVIYIINVHHPIFFFQPVL